MLSRRRFLQTSIAAAGLVGVLPRAVSAAGPVTLTAQPMSFLLPGCTAPSTLWGYNATWPLELRLQRGQPFEAVLKNALPEQRSEEHTSELQSLMRISYAVFCLTKKNKTN